MYFKHLAVKENVNIILKEHDSNTIILFIGGMESYFFSPPFVSNLFNLNANVAQVQLRSHPFFGSKTLDNDKDDIYDTLQKIEKYFLDKKRKKNKFILVGHSTGCQSILYFLDNSNKKFDIFSCLLIGPVSDRNFMEGREIKKRSKNNTSEGEKDQKIVLDATKIVEKNMKTLSLEQKIILAKKDKNFRYIFGSSVIYSRRFLDLFEINGKDDFFSHDSKSKVNNKNQKIIFIICKNDEFVFENNYKRLENINNSKLVFINSDHGLNYNYDEFECIIEEELRKCEFE